jgi:hypothetical protein
MFFVLSSLVVDEFTEWDQITGCMMRSKLHNFFPTNFLSWGTHTHTHIYLIHDSIFFASSCSALFFSNLWSSWIGDHWQEDLARFGYRSEKKVEFFQDSSYIVATCWNLLFKYGNFKTKNLTEWQIGPIFSKKEILCIICISPLYFWMQKSLLGLHWNLGNKTSSSISNEKPPMNEWIMYYLLGCKM